MTTYAITAWISRKKVDNRDGNPQDINEVLTTAFETDDYLDCIRNAQARDIAPLAHIDKLDKIDHRKPSSGIRTTKTVHTSVKKDMWIV
ncbi:hypothetical protein BDM02DRAFT_3121083 [Thelephora ganbajun]|uniref:Uncharacterized protein n=1 Tax=Thelephora ganbajun TaxID=370292 RepID=A0ACB6Z5W1_THEGA|nr:hypothetical protein BDM02DRAFT_3121083 [Thelephora ganbajun]